MRNKSFDNKIIRAKNAKDAVKKALEQILDKWWNCKNQKNYP